MIRFQNLAAGVLQAVSATVPEGAMALVLGANGAGKSTLLRCAAGLQVPSAGSVECPAPAALIPQDADCQILGGTVLEDLLLPWVDPGAPLLERARTLAQRYALPETAATRLLSGGEKRKLTLAAALMACPSVLLMDEPTAGLDWPACKAFARDLSQLRERGTTLLAATHDPQVFLPAARAGDLALILQGGRLVQACTIGEARRAVAANPALGIRPF